MDKIEQDRIKIIGEAIKEGRKKRRWTQKELATFMGVHTTLVSKWENCRGVPTGDDLLKLATELDIVHLLFSDYFPHTSNNSDDCSPLGAEIVQLKHETAEIKKRLSKIEGFFSQMAGLVQ